MYRITIVAVGSLKESYWRDAVKEYQKRLNPYAKVDIKEVNEEPFRNVSDKERIFAIEAERIKKNIPKDSLIILLDREGREMSSERFAEFLQQNGEGGAHLCFVIGGPLGIGAEIRQNAHISISFSCLTFTHQITRVLLFEQLYRALTIIHGKAYHY